MLLAHLRGSHRLPVLILTIGFTPVIRRIISAAMRRSAAFVRNGREVARRDIQRCGGFTRDDTNADCSDNIVPAVFRYNAGREEKRRKHRPKDESPKTLMRRVVRSGLVREIGRRQNELSIGPRTPLVAHRDTRASARRRVQTQE